MITHLDLKQNINGLHGDVNSTYEYNGRLASTDTTGTVPGWIVSEEYETIFTNEGLPRSEWYRRVYSLAKFYSTSTAFGFIICLPLEYTNTGREDLRAVFGYPQQLISFDTPHFLNIKLNVLSYPLKLTCCIIEYGYRYEYGYGWKISKISGADLSLMSPGFDKDEINDYMITYSNFFDLSGPSTSSEWIDQYRALMREYEVEYYKHIGVQYKNL